MPFTSAILKIFSLMLRGTYTLCATVLSNGFLAWLIVFYSGSLLLLYWINQSIKKHTFAVQNIALLTIQNFRNRALWNSGFFAYLCLRIPFIQQVKNFFSECHCPIYRFHVFSPTNYYSCVNTRQATFA